MRFSIIIPTYNRAHLIAATINSVLEQIYQDWELIIVDDGSTDSTQVVVSGFQDERIKYFWKENEERNVARNFGVQQASGDYVFFLDSDDLIYKDHLQNAHEFFTNNSEAVFYHSRYELIGEEGRSQVPELRGDPWKHIKKQNKFACQFFLKYALAKEYTFCEDSDLKIGEDWLLILQIGNKHQLHYSSEVSSAIVCHEERSMNVANSEVILKSLAVIIRELRAIDFDPSNLKWIEYELRSLALLSRSLSKNKSKVLQDHVKLYTRFPSRFFSRRSFAILKHYFIS